MIGKKKFVAAAFDPENEIFVVYVMFFAISNEIHPFYIAQIALLNIDEAIIIIPPKYFDFVDIFFPELAVELPEYMEINNHIINLIDGKQLVYGLIYSPQLVELETLKTYIKTKLVNGFITPFKSLVNALILFD